MVKSVLIKLI